MDGMSGTRLTGCVGRVSVEVPWGRLGLVVFVPWEEGKSDGGCCVVKLRGCEREQDVLAMMIDGLNNTDIAAKLVVSPAIVISHVSHIVAKLGVSSRTVRHDLLN